MTYKLLIVDDEPLILKTLVRQLEDLGLQIITKTSPFEAKELIKNTTVDILLTDQKMPGITGLDLVKYFRSESPNTVAILMSAFADFEVMTCAINEGHVFHFISKPWNQFELIDAIHKAMDYKEQESYKESLVKSYLVDKEKWMLATSMYEQNVEKNEENLISAFKKIIEVKDKELYLHSIRVAEIAVKFARYLGLDAVILDEVKHSGEFHDLGKIVIKDRILYKESSLDADEYEEMKRHPLVGADVLREIESLKNVANIVEQHHERDDGRGYPKGLMGESISIEAIIISLADAYDALTSERTYKSSKTREEAISIMLNGGAGIFHTQLLSKFQKFMLN